ncbi:MAG: hypothetical protein M1816_002399 [Peltula sp. TS41687]|nr:MAG: hypothetical protein M1816_002399 [Peltula sp. TS41687]
MNTRRSHCSGEAAGDPADSGSTVVPGTQPATFQAAQARDDFEDPPTTQSTTTRNERSREELLEEISRLEAGNRELRLERHQTLERRAQELREEQARLREGLSTAKQVPPLPEYHGKNWAKYYSYTSQIKLNCEYKPSIAPTERDKMLYTALPCNKSIKDSWRLFQKGDSRLLASPTWKDFKEFLSSVLEHPALSRISTDPLQTTRGLDRAPDRSTSMQGFVMLDFKAVGVLCLISKQ